jgi:two-component system, response regulator PdtaR
MSLPKRSSLAHPGMVVHPVSRFRPRLVYASDDSRGPSASERGGARVLVVEDDYLVSGEMDAELTAAGFDVVAVATSADEAVRLAGAEKPQLIVMDVRLEGGSDGVEAAIQIFQLLGIRCLFASAYHDAETRRRAAAAAPLGWLAKPYTMASLVLAVRAALRNIEPPAGV